MFKEIEKCRICGNKNFIEVFDLKNQALTGVFPNQENIDVPVAPLILVKCDDENFSGTCGLVQLKHTSNLDLMYGENYGYRTGLNASMLEHVQGIPKKILSFVDLKKDDFVIDIGSNDSSLLQAYKRWGIDNIRLLGVDPSAKKFKNYYPDYIDYLPDFFTKAKVQKAMKDKGIQEGKKAKIITSISMFYDLEAPQDLMQEVYDLLDDNGVWVLEQSYLPSMILANSFDTICHEHLEYYSLKQIHWMAEIVGFKFLNIEFNDVNGGSFALTLAKKNSYHKEETPLLKKVLAEEKEKAYSSEANFKVLKNRIDKNIEKLQVFLKEARLGGKTVFGYGASTKGNVLLQYANLSSKELNYIAEVNENKFGCFTPGTKIKIISEQEAKEKNPDYFLVLPWHFKNNILRKEQDYLKKNPQVRFVFPLPEFNII